MLQKRVKGGRSPAAVTWNKGAAPYGRLLKEKIIISQTKGLIKL